MPEARAIGDANDGQPFHLNFSLEDIAERVGATVTSLKQVRLPIRFRTELEVWIKRQGLTGRLSLDYSQGTAGWIVWEERRHG